MKEQINYEFVVDVAPSRETILEFHKNLAKILINKYGKETMKKVVTYVETKE